MDTNKADTEVPLSDFISTFTVLIVIDGPHMTGRYAQRASERRITTLMLALIKRRILFTEITTFRCPWHVSYVFTLPMKQRSKLVHRLPWGQQVANLPKLYTCHWSILAGIVPTNHTSSVAVEVDAS